MLPGKNSERIWKINHFSIFFKHCKKSISSILISWKYCYQWGIVITVVRQRNLLCFPHSVSSTKCPLDFWCLARWALDMYVFPHPGKGHTLLRTSWPPCVNFKWALKFIGRNIFPHSGPTVEKKFGWKKLNFWQIMIDVCVHLQGIWFSVCTCRCLLRALLHEKAFPQRLQGTASPCCSACRLRDCFVVYMAGHCNKMMQEISGWSYLPAKLID